MVGDAWLDGLDYAFVKPDHEADQTKRETFGKQLDKIGRLCDSIAGMC